MNYAIYLRKSRADVDAEKQGELETLARHEKTLMDYARRNKLSITAIYKEIVSGETISARPEVQRLLNDIESEKYTGVLVMEVERLARGDTIDQGIIAQTFKLTGTKIITPLKIYDPNNEFDEEYFEFGLFMARREYKTINRRIQRGRTASVNEGKYIGSQPAFGYDKVRLTDGKGYTLMPNSDAEIVKHIYDLYVNQNAGMTLIASELDKLHVKPQKSATWSKCTIQNILTNPVYIGKIRWSYKKETKTTMNGITTKKRSRSKEYTLIDGIHEGIIDIDTFEKAQRIRLKKGHAPVKGSDVLKNPFTGIIYCGKCGQLMTRLAPSKRNKYDTIKCPNRNCDNVSAPIFLVEKKLLKSLEIWLQEYKLSLELHENNHAQNYSGNVKKNALYQIKIQIDKTSQQLDATYDLLEQGLYTKEKFLERNRILSDKLSELKIQQQDLENQVKDSVNRNELKNNTIPMIESVLDGYYNLPGSAEKNILLRSILNKIEYVKTERNTRGNLNNDNFELVLYPTVPYEL